MAAGPAGKATGGGGQGRPAECIWGGSIGTAGLRMAQALGAVVQHHRVVPEPAALVQPGQGAGGDGPKDSGCPLETLASHRLAAKAEPSMITCAPDVCHSGPLWPAACTGAGQGRLVSAGDGNPTHPPCAPTSLACVYSLMASCVSHREASGNGGWRVGAS